MRTVLDVLDLVGLLLIAAALVALAGLALVLAGQLAVAGVGVLVVVEVQEWRWRQPRSMRGGR